jgi:hypothetical protein
VKDLDNELWILIGSICLGSFIILIIYYFEKGIKEKEDYKQYELEKQNKKIEASEKMRSLSIQLSEIIEQTYNVFNCSRCDEKYHEVDNFNTQYTSICVKCVSCNKAQWAEIVDDTDVEQVIDLYNRFTDCVKRNAWLIDPDSIIVESDAKIVRIHRQAITSEIKKEVWQRDEGKCVKCGSQENLEYDHIIPVSKGGANTARNIQLLCEPCNRKKSANIE